MCLRRDECIFPRLQWHSGDDRLPTACYRIAAWLLPTSDAVGQNVPAISLKGDPPGRIELPVEKPISPERRRIRETPRRSIAAATSEPRKNGRSGASSASGVDVAMTAVRNPRLAPCEPHGGPRKIARRVFGSRGCRSSPASDHSSQSGLSLRIRFTAGGGAGSGIPCAAISAWMLASSASHAWVRAVWTCM